MGIGIKRGAGRRVKSVPRGLDPGQGREPSRHAVAAVGEEPIRVPEGAETAAADALDPQRFEPASGDPIQVREPPIRPRRRRGRSVPPLERGGRATFVLDPGRGERRRAMRRGRRRDMPRGPPGRLRRIRPRSRGRATRAARRPDAPSRRRSARSPRPQVRASRRGRRRPGCRPRRRAPPEDNPRSALRTAASRHLRRWRRPAAPWRSGPRGRRPSRGPDPASTVHDRTPGWIRPSSGCGRPRSGRRRSWQRG